MHCLSAKAWGFYKFTGGQDHLNFKQGYSSLVNLLTDDLAEGVLKLNSPVININWSKYNLDEKFKTRPNPKMFNGISYNWNSNNVCEGNEQIDLFERLQCDKESSVVVTCKDNIQYHAEHVIVTSSIGFLKANLESLFRPALPQILQEVSIILLTINSLLYNSFLCPVLANIYISIVHHISVYSVY